MLANLLLFLHSNPLMIAIIIKSTSYKSYDLQIEINTPHRNHRKPLGIGIDMDKYFQ